MVTPEDIRKVGRDQWVRTAVRAIMTPAERLEVVARDGELADALEKLYARDVQQLPVAEEGRLVGMIHRRDILRWLALRRRDARGWWRRSA